MKLDTGCVRFSVGDKNPIIADMSGVLGGFCRQVRVMPGHDDRNDGGRAWTARKKGDKFPYILFAPSAIWEKDFETEGFYDLQEIVMR